MAYTQLTDTMLSINIGKNYYCTLRRVWGREWGAAGRIKPTAAPYGTNTGRWPVPPSLLRCIPTPSFHAFLWGLLALQDSKQHPCPLPTRCRWITSPPCPPSCDNPQSLQMRTEEPLLSSTRLFLSFPPCYLRAWGLNSFIWLHF